MWKSLLQTPGGCVSISCCVFTQTPNPIKVTAGNLFNIYFFPCAFVSHTMQVCITRVQMRQARQAWVELLVFWVFFCFNLKRILWVQKHRQRILAAWQSFQFNLFTKVYLWELPYIAFLPQKPSLVQSIFVKTVLIFMFRRLKSFRS